MSEPASDEPILLSGPPDALRATVSLENSSDKRISVRNLVIRRSGEADVAARFGAILAPASHTTVPLQVALSPVTAPGEYDAEIEIGGQARTARLRVEAKIAARISPSRLLAAPGTSEITVLLVNQGNVDIPIARHSRARTQDDGPDYGPDVDFELTAAAVLAAGADLTLTAQLTVPDDLDPTRRHQAVVPVGVCDLTVLVLPREGTPRELSRKPSDTKASSGSAAKGTS